MPTFQTGWVKDRPDLRDIDARASGFLKAAAPPSSSASNADLVKVIDQKQLGSCTVNGAGQAIRAAELLELVEADRVAWEAAGNDAATFDAVASLNKWQGQAEFWSRLMMYYLARSYDGNVKDDTGTEIRLVFQAANKYGFCPESIWPYSDDSSPGAPFTRMPPANAFRLAYDQRLSAENQKKNLIDYARITSTGTQRVQDVMTAVSARHLVVFGCPVTDAFCRGDINGGAPIPKPSSSDPIAGGHAMAIASYNQRGAGVVNSWGTAGFNPNGLGGVPAGWCTFGWDYLEWSETTDLWIVKRAPLEPAKGA